MRIDKDEIIAEFKLVHFGAKGWMRSDNTPCPECGKTDKFGILFLDEGAVTHCFYNCGANLSIFDYLRKIKREDLIEYDKVVKLNKLKRPEFVKEKEEEKEKIKINLPIGYKRIYFDNYLFNRNFLSYQYDQFEVGITEHFLERKLHNYLIFVLKQKGEIVGWLARSKNSKKWHKQNLERSKQDLEPLKLRYENSSGIEFTEILGGFEEITENTKTAILVEGIFDKTNVSNILKTEDSEELKVCFTFGNSVSEEQITLLKETNIVSIIMMYDHGTITQLRQCSAELSKYFNVDVCNLPLEYTEKGEEIDPGNANENFITKILNNKKNFIYFYCSNLNFKKFK